jgi:nifR3 family TIM-barrel protein
MADVTDAAFRRLIAKYGKPDVTWTEFVAVDGLVSRGREALLVDLLHTEAERPIVAQVFGAKPEHFAQVATLVAELGFDGLDINMGCPDRNVEKQGAGAAMMKDPGLAKAVILAAKEGSRGLPVSVKTRIGYNSVQLETWLPELLSVKPAAITVHARTRKELSEVPAQWEYVRRAVEIAKGSGVVMLGNGDVKDLDDARLKAKESGVDGVMIGRGVFGNPWRFNPTVRIEDIPLAERLHVMVEHTKLFSEILGEVKNFAIMKKHYKAYVHGFDGAKELRTALMETGSAEEVETLVDAFLNGK